MVLDDDDDYADARARLLRTETFIRAGVRAPGWHTLTEAQRDEWRRAAEREGRL